MPSPLPKLTPGLLFAGIVLAAYLTTAKPKARKRLLKAIEGVFARLEDPRMANPLRSLEEQDEGRRMVRELRYWWNAVRVYLVGPLPDGKAKP